MSDADFNKCSELALRLTRMLFVEFDLHTFGLDEVAVFNCVLKQIVTDGSSQ